VLDCRSLEAVAHETKPPARYTEATLVRALEAEGIGRPSTYASIIGTIQDRGYVRKSGNQLVPTFTALAVTRLLEDYFPRLVDTGFTAEMEQTLDEIAMGRAQRLPYLKSFYCGQQGLDEQVKDKEESIDPRAACTLQLAGVEPAVRVGRYGPYFEQQRNGEKLTASIPDDIAPADLSNEVAQDLLDKKKEGPKPLGMHPEEGLPVYLLNGPFGPYVQLGDVTEEVPKPKRVSLTRVQDPATLDLNTAVALLSLPRRLGQHPETGKVVNAGIGRFGPYVLHDKTYGNFDKKTHTYDYQGQTWDVLTIPLEAAVDLLKHTKKRGPAAPLRELGKHPEDGEPVAIYEGRYGPYVKHGKVNATIPKDREPDQVTFEEALDLLARKQASPGGRTKGGRKKSARPVASTTKKTSAGRKAPRKKAARKKAS
jgi:DNA topoisomerase I